MNNQEKLPLIGSLFKSCVDGQLAILTEYDEWSEVGTLIAVAEGKDNSLGKEYYKRFHSGSTWTILKGKRR